MATNGSYSLDEIADRLAIEQVIARYVHALDGWRMAGRTWRHGWIWGDYPLASLPGEF